MDSVNGPQFVTITQSYQLSPQQLITDVPRSAAGVVVALGPAPAPRGCGGGLVDWWAGGLVDGLSLGGGNGGRGLSLGRLLDWRIDGLVD